MKILVIIIGALLLGLCIFSLTPQGVEYFGLAYGNANYKIFKENYAYKDGKAEHIKRLQLELAREKDPLVKQALEEYIQTER